MEARPHALGRGVRRAPVRPPARAPRRVPASARAAASGPALPDQLPGQYRRPKRASVTDLYSFSACGSFREEMAPGDFVIVDQFIDRTFAREKSVFDTSCVAHVAFGHPVSPILPRARPSTRASAHIAAARISRLEGPQFSTLAESRLYRSWGCDVIGMTNMPEAKLAREAELPYATVAMVTD